MTGRLYGVGVGPGDPELVTVKAARLIGEADVVVFHSARHGRSVARRIAEPYLRGDQIEEQLVYPVTTEDSDDYQGEIDAFYAECATRLAAHLDAGRTVVVLAAGDPFFYGSYMHLHKRLADRYPAEVVPGVTSVSAGAAVIGKPLVERDEVLTVLPGTLPVRTLVEHLAAGDPVAIMKLGRTFPHVREALERSGRLDEAWYVERATTGKQRTAPLSEVDADSVPYFSLALLPSRAAAADVPQAGTGEVVVVGLGPAGPEWLTPEAREALARADDLVGYITYLNRVTTDPRQRKHASDNKVESERAAFALDLARRGRRVAVVSSGDPGVFAMASAVLEVAAEEQFADVPVRVLPGLTAAHAVASRAGAPLGHDYCVVSLSDRLKPWDVIAERLEAAGRADLVLAIYNPASRSRTWQVAAARDLLLGHRSPDTPVVIGRDVGGPEETVRVVRLADLDPADVDMRCLLLIGSSQTRVTGRGTVFTPRRYPS
ncbi:precorrin-2 C20-methyltransferase/precorrin-3B C17-methyltransferase [Saccharothrix tamanrassetensis]|uniref:Precorrin-2 C20-methyltransferase/precorrin-3B C17-methyltransferase n=1 Tax=Saccharothrix tamanrassetensis TaxID=1051531 RepID=A0A841CLJ6_9PSEU|nr:precorrin-2 C(20)-methyltransferase [Saccharothrix tamanrassetensis]MBB5959362.1 precorrin-2 C20-methyltransferase/precorrin-3B C17-methyltransferase [Saccharothrix tamanrassetensis]